MLFKTREADFVKFAYPKKNPEYFKTARYINVTRSTFTILIRGQRRRALYSRWWSRRRSARRSRALAETLRSRATNSQAHRFVIAIYDCGPRSLAASLFPRVLPSSFPTGRALNGVLNNGFIYGAWNTRRDARDMRDGRVYDAENTNCIARSRDAALLWASQKRSFRATDS